MFLIRIDAVKPPFHSLFTRYWQLPPAATELLLEEEELERGTELLLTALLLTRLLLTALLARLLLIALLDEITREEDDNAELDVAPTIPNGAG